MSFPRRILSTSPKAGGLAWVVLLLAVLPRLAISEPIEEIEPNDSVSTAHDIGILSSGGELIVCGRLETHSALDVFSFTTTRVDQTVLAQVDSQRRGWELDSVIRILNGNVDWLDQNDDASCEPSYEVGGTCVSDPHLRVTVPTPQEMYVIVQADLEWTVDTDLNYCLVIRDDLALFQDDTALEADPPWGEVLALNGGEPLPDGRAHLYTDLEPGTRTVRWGLDAPCTLVFDTDAQAYDWDSDCYYPSFYSSKTECEIAITQTDDDDPNIYDPWEYGTSDPRWQANGLDWSPTSCDGNLDYLWVDQRFYLTVYQANTIDHWDAYHEVFCRAEQEPNDAGDAPWALDTTDIAVQDLPTLIITTETVRGVIDAADPFRGNPDSPDLDYYSFRAQAGQRAAVFLFSEAFGSTTGEMQIDLFDPGGTLLSTASGTDPRTRVVDLSEEGLHYIRVRDNTYPQGSAASVYSLRLELSWGEPTSELEPNDNITEAHRLGILPQGDEIIVCGELSSSDPVDVFRFEPATENQTALVQVDSERRLGTLDAVIQVLDETGDTIDQNDNASCEPGYGPGGNCIVDPQLRVTLPAPKATYVLVSSSTPLTGPRRYCLLIRDDQAHFQDDTVAEVDPDFGFVVALNGSSPLPEGRAHAYAGFTGSLYDVFRFRVDAPCTLVVDTDAGGFQPGFDFYYEFAFAHDPVDDCGVEFDWGLNTDDNVDVSTTDPRVQSSGFRWSPTGCADEAEALWIDQWFYFVLAEWWNPPPYFAYLDAFCRAELEPNDALSIPWDRDLTDEEDEVDPWSPDFTDIADQDLPNLLVAKETVRGVIDSTDPFRGLPEDADVDVYSVRAVEGDTAILHLYADSIGSETGVLQIELFDPLGNLLGSASGVEPELGPFVITETGMHFIRIEDTTNPLGGPGSVYGLNAHISACSDNDRDGYSWDGDIVCSGGPEPDCNELQPEINPGAFDDDAGEDMDCDGLYGDDLLQPGDLVISEVMLDPLGSPHPENARWVEVHNRSDESGHDYAINLRNWWIDINRGYRTEFLEADSNAYTIIDPGESLVIGLTWDPAETGGADVDIEGVYLPNTTESIWIDVDVSNYDEESNPNPEPLFGDAFFFKEMTPPEIPAGYSLSLDPTRFSVEDNDDPANWCRTPEVYVLAGGDFATPGERNPPCCPDVDEDGDLDEACGGLDCDDSDPDWNTWDVDEDGFGSCEGDCDDDDPNIHPYAVEDSGNEVDDDCDDVLNECVYEVQVDGSRLPIGIPDAAYDGTLDSMECVDMEIPDNDDDHDLVEQVHLTAALNHTFIGDLVIKLVSPEETVLTLLSRPGAAEELDDGSITWGYGATANLVADAPLAFGDAFDDDVETMGYALETDDVVCVDDGRCQYAANPGAGPGSSFADFIGENAVGTWRLCVGDSVSGDVGTIVSATLILQRGTGEEIPTVYPDGDEDGFGDPLYPTTSCFPPEDLIATGGDCDDEDFDINPGADELCDEIDNDCNGMDDVLGFDDSETDDDEDGYSECQGDRDDDDENTYPGADEVCDGQVDNSCDGVPDPNELDDDEDGASPCDGDCDDEDETLNLLDEDEDGVTTCDGDCDDFDRDRFPGNTEVCDGRDNDCDDVVDFEDGRCDEPDPEDMGPDLVDDADFDDVDLDDTDSDGEDFQDDAPPSDTAASGDVPIDTPQKPKGCGCALSPQPSGLLGDQAIPVLVFVGLVLLSSRRRRRA